MYDVLKYLSRVDNLKIFTIGDGDHIERIPITGITCDFLNDHIEFPIKEFKLSWTHSYNNLALKGNSLKSDLIILQDYGDNCEGIKDVEVPKWVMLPDLHPSLGWYDGCLCYIVIIEDYQISSTTTFCPPRVELVVCKLCEFPKIDLDLIRDKVPFNFGWVLPKQFDPESEIKLWVDIKPGYGASYNPSKAEFLGTKILEVFNHPIYKDWFHPANIDYMSQYNYLPKEVVDEVDNYLNPNMLVRLGFGYIPTNDYIGGKWFKDDKVIYQDGEYFTTTENGDEYLWTFDDLRNFMHGNTPTNK